MVLSTMKEFQNDTVSPLTAIAASMTSWVPST